MSVQQDLAKAKSLLKKGRVPEAREHYYRVLAKFPNNKTALDGLKHISGVGSDPIAQKRASELHQIVALFKSGKTVAAYERFVVLEADHPEHPELLNLKGALLSRQDRLAEAIEAYERCLELRPNQLEVLVNLGKALLAVGRLQDGIRRHHEALTLAPRNPGVVLRLAGALRTAGERNAARQVLETAATLMPQNVEIQAELANLKSFKAGDPQLGHLEKLRDTPGLKAGQIRSVNFALGRAYDSAGLYEQAFDAFGRGNAERRAEFDYSPEQDLALFNNVKAAFDTGLSNLMDETAGPQPIFIVGMPRSGTTLTEQILGAHPEVQGAGELRFFAQFVRPIFLEHGKDARGLLDASRLATLRDDYLATIAGLAEGANFVVDKMPINFSFVGVIAAMFPKAPILHMKRDARAVCWSIFRQNFGSSGNRYAFNLEETVAFHGLYEDLMEFWHDKLPGRILDVPYEDLTQNPESQVRRILEYCGLEWDPGVLAFHETKRAVRTASSAQVREAIYTGSSQEWRNYAPFVGAAFDGLGEA